MKPRLLDLFSGIGGFSLGLERAGFETIAFCETEPWCRRVLAKHWPAVPAYTDVRELTAARLRADGIERVDAICGGFPCQDISLAGTGRGLDGERSGLWREFARLVGELRPRYAIVENVGALRGRGLAAVLGDLAAVGFDGTWHVVPAAAVGAPHLRERCWIVGVAADAAGERSGQAQALAELDREGWRPQADGRAAADADPIGQRQGTQAERDQTGRADFTAAPAHPDPHRRRRQSERLAQHGDEQRQLRTEPDGLGEGGLWRGSASSDAAGVGLSQLRGLQRRLARALAAASTPWERTTEAPLRRVDDELPPGLDRSAGLRYARARRAQDRERLKALGNAVVPLIPEIIGHELLMQIPLAR